MWYNLVISPEYPESNICIRKTHEREERVNVLGLCRWREGCIFW